MIMHAEISFAKKNHDDGFGFDCMKTAYSFGLTGRMDYGTNVGVVIQAEGEQGMIDGFVTWIKVNIKDADHICCHTSQTESKKFKEFDIFKHTF
jgi:hypothetical protein